MTMDRRASPLHFLREALRELRRVAWPTQQCVGRTSAVTAFVVLASTALLALVDIATRSGISLTLDR